MFVFAVVLLEAVMLPRGLSWRVVDVQIGGADTGVSVFVGLGFETGRFCFASVISARLAGLHRFYRPIVLLRCISQRQMRVLLEYPAALRILLVPQSIDAAMRTAEHVDSLHLNHLPTADILLNVDGCELGSGGGVTVLLGQ